LRVILRMILKTRDGSSPGKAAKVNSSSGDTSKDNHAFMMRRWHESNLRGHSLMESAATPSRSGSPAPGEGRPGFNQTPALPIQENLNSRSPLQAIVNASSRSLHRSQESSVELLPRGWQDRLDLEGESHGKSSSPPAYPPLISSEVGQLQSHVYERPQEHQLQTGKSYGSSRGTDIGENAGAHRAGIAITVEYGVEFSNAQEAAPAVPMESQQHAMRTSDFAGPEKPRYPGHQRPWSGIPPPPPMPHQPDYPWQG